MIPQNDAAARRERLQKIAESGLEYLNGRKSKVTILGHEIALQDGVAQVGNAIDWAQEFLREAIKDVPYAPAVMAGVALVLPFLKNPAAVDTANQIGFIYVTSQMRYYGEMEHLLLPDDMTAGLRNILKEAIVELYKLVIQFQIRSVIRFYRNGVKNYFRGVFNYDAWDSLLEHIKEEQTRLERMFENALHGASIHQLKKVSKETEESRKALNQTLDKIKELVQLSRQQQEARSREEQKIADLEFRKRLNALRLTDPTLDKDRIEDSKGGLLKDCYCWILQNSAFQSWLNSTEGQLLWIHGTPGKGKTMLMCGIIDELSAKKNRSNVAFSFCQATSTHLNSATSVLRGILFMLVQQQRSLIEHITEDSFNGENSWYALVRIFDNILNDTGLRDTFILVDALDECEIDRDRLLGFLEKKSCVSSRVKWLVSSRNWSEIERGLSNAVQTKLCLELNEANLSAAVESFIQANMLELVKRRVLSSEEMDDVCCHLKDKADGTFLWVALVCQQLTHIPKRDFNATLKRFPTGLDQLYQRMMDQIKNCADVGICQTVLSILTNVFRPLSLNELKSYIDLPQNVSDEDDLKDIIASCGSFLTLRKNTIYLVHQSAKEFLLKQDCLFPIGIHAVHHSIFSRSMTIIFNTLVRDIYDLRSPGYPSDQVKPRESDPLATARYACVYWINHLIESFPDSTGSEVLHEAGLISKFFSESFLHWVEALSLLNSFYLGLTSLLALQKILMNKIRATGLLEIIQDATHFMLYHKVGVEDHPLQVYACGLVFSPRSSVIRRVYERKVASCIRQKPSMKDDWDACLQTLEGHEAPVKYLSFSHDSSTLISALDDRTIKIWDTDSGKCLNTLVIGELAFPVLLSGDSKILISPSLSPFAIDIWDAASGYCIHSLKGHSTVVRSVALLNSCSPLVASASFDSTVKIWDVTSGDLLHTLIHPVYVDSIAFSSPESKLLASGSWNGEVRIWHTSRGTCEQTLVVDAWIVDAIVFSEDGNLLFARSSGIVRIWDVDSWQCLYTLKYASYGTAYVRVKERLLAVGSNILALPSEENPSHLQVYNTSSGKCVHNLDHAHDGFIQALKFSPNSDLLVSAAEDQILKLWDSATGHCLYTLEGHGGPVHTVSFSHDSKIVASASQDNTVKIWDISTHHSRGNKINYINMVHGDKAPSLVTFSNDSKLAASFIDKATIQISSIEDHQCIKPLSVHTKQIQFSPDATILATGSLDGIIELWDTRSGESRNNLIGHNGSIYSMAFSPGNESLVSVSTDDTMRVWDVGSGECQKVVNVRDVFCSACFSDSSLLIFETRPGHSNCDITDLSSGESLQNSCIDRAEIAKFSPDFKFLVAADTKICLWDISTGHYQSLKMPKEHNRIFSGVIFSDDSKLVAAAVGGIVTVWEVSSGQSLESFDAKSIYLELFSLSKFSLHTSLGTIRLSFASNPGSCDPQYPQQPCFEDYHIDPNCEWICWNDKKVLWIPPEYRPIYSIVSGSSLCLVPFSKQVLWLDFDPSGPPVV